VITPGDELDQVADDVRSLVLPSVYEPVAVSCSPAPSGKEGLPAFTAIETSAAADTVRFALPVMLEAEAEIAAVPADLAVAAPVFEIAITPGDELDHVAEDVRSLVVPSV
jgi:hypothetical protein